MAAGTAQVGTLRLRSAAGDTPAVRLAASTWLGGAELHPGGLPPSAVLIVRRMADPLPGLLPAGGPALPDPAWERAARASLEGFHRRAARPARGPVPPGAEAVLFADEAEMLACLAQDLARGNALACWWWTLVLRRLRTWDLPSLFLQKPEQVPALLHHLAEKRQAAEVCTPLKESEALEILISIARSHAAPTLISAFPGTAGAPPAGGRGTVTVTGRAAALTTPPAHPIQAPRPTWQKRLQAIPDIAHLAPANRVLLATALALFEEPAKARSIRFAAEMRVWWEAGAPVEREERQEAQEVEERVKQEGGARGTAPSPPDPHRPSAGLSHSLPPGEGAPPPPLEIRGSQEPSRWRGVPPPDLPPEPTVPLPGGRDAGSEVRGEIEAALEADSLPSRNAEAVSRDPEAVRPNRPVVRPEESVNVRASSVAPVEAEAEAPAPLFEEGVATEIAGIFYLVNLMTALDIPDGFEEDWHLASEVGAWGVLDAIARALLGDAALLAGDPVWTVLALLAGREPDEPPGSEGLTGWLALTLPHLRLRLAQGLGLDPARPEELAPLLLLQPGRVYVTPTHVDVVMDLATVALPVRISGLDRDPGWVPAFGRVIQFHFQ